VVWVLLVSFSLVIHCCCSLRVLRVRLHNILHLILYALPVLWCLENPSSLKFGKYLPILFLIRFYLNSKIYLESIFV
jgi:hypothetical protein